MLTNDSSNVFYSLPCKVAPSRIIFYPTEWGKLDIAYCILGLLHLLHPVLIRFISLFNRNLS